VAVGCSAFARSGSRSAVDRRPFARPPDRSVVLARRL